MAGATVLIADDDSAIRTVLNQAFARIFVVASSTAIVFWSFRMVKGQLISVGLGIYGSLLGPALVIALVAGGLRLDVHGFGLITFSQAVWFILAGVLLMRSRLDQKTAS